MAYFKLSGCCISMPTVIDMRQARAAAVSHRAPAAHLPLGCVLGIPGRLFYTTMWRRARRKVREPKEGSGEERACILAGIEVLLPTGQQQAGRAAPSLVDAALFEARYDVEALSAASVASIGRENGGSFL